MTPHVKKLNNRYNFCKQVYLLVKAYTLLVCLFAKIERYFGRVVTSKASESLRFSVCLCKEAHFFYVQKQKGVHTMQKIGIIRKSDGLGRVVVPIEMRRALKWDKDTELEIFAENGGVFLRKFSHDCIFCGSNENVRCFEERMICERCIERLQK